MQQQWHAHIARHLAPRTPCGGLPVPAAVCCAHAVAHRWPARLRLHLILPLSSLQQRLSRAAARAAPAAPLAPAPRALPDDVAGCPAWTERARTQRRAALPMAAGAAAAAAVPAAAGGPPAWARWVEAARLHGPLIHWLAPAACLAEAAPAAREPPAAAAAAADALLWQEVPQAHGPPLGLPPGACCAGAGGAAARWREQRRRRRLQTDAPGPPDAAAPTCGPAAGRRGPQPGSFAGLLRLLATAAWSRSCVGRCAHCRKVLDVCRLHHRGWQGPRTGAACSSGGPVALGLPALPVLPAADAVVGQ